MQLRLLSPHLNKRHSRLLWQIGDLRPALVTIDGGSVGVDCENREAFALHVPVDDPPVFAGVIGRPDDRERRTRFGQQRCQIFHVLINASGVPEDS